MNDMVEVDLLTWKGLVQAVGLGVIEGVRQRNYTSVNDSVRSYIVDDKIIGQLVTFDDYPPPVPPREVNEQQMWMLPEYIASTEQYKPAP